MLGVWGQEEHPAERDARTKALRMKALEHSVPGREFGERSVSLLLQYLLSIKRILTAGRAMDTAWPPMKHRVSTSSSF